MYVYMRNNVQLKDDPWGHVEHCDANCACLESDRTEAHIHNLLPMPETSDLRMMTKSVGRYRTDSRLTMTVDTWVLAVRGIYRLYQRNRGHMAGCC